MSAAWWRAARQRLRLSTSSEGPHVGYSRSEVLLWRTWRATVITAQFLAGVHLLTTHVCEVRMTTGSSMLPTLAADGDQVLTIAWPAYYLYQHIKKSAGSLGGIFTTLSPEERQRREEDAAWEHINLRKHKNIYGLKLGDLVVATSPTDPSKTVCKRVVGLPGDTVLLDPRRDEPTLTVPKGHVFLCGDNLNNSTDSRHYGPVPIGLVKGKIVSTVFPFPPVWLRNNLEVIT